MAQFFEQVSCITVDTESKRARDIQVNLQKVGLDFTFYVFERVAQQNVAAEPENTKLNDILKYGSNMVGPLGRSLAQSHVWVIEQAFIQNKQNVLVLEDDAEFDLELTAKYMPGIVDWLKTHEWDIFNFGAVQFPVPLRIQLSPGVAVATGQALLCHCYVLSRSGMLRVLEMWYSYKRPLPHIDKLYAVLFQGKYHLAHPSLSYQTEKPAMFRQAMSLLPCSISDKLDLKTFKEFCQLYEYRATWWLLFSLLGLVVLVGLVKKLVVNELVKNLRMNMVSR